MYGLPWRYCRSSSSVTSENECKRLCAFVVEVYVQFPRAGRRSAQPGRNKNKGKTNEPYRTESAKSS